MILKGSLVSSDFLTFSAVDTILCVISGGLLYTVGASFNVGASQENSILRKRCNDPSQQ